MDQDGTATSPDTPSEEAQGGTGPLFVFCGPSLPLGRLDFPDVFVLFTFVGAEWEQ